MMVERHGLLKIFKWKTLNFTINDFDSSFPYKKIKSPREGSILENHRSLPTTPLFKCILTKPVKCFNPLFSSTVKRFFLLH